MTSNIDCSQNNNTATTNIIQISVMSGMNAQLQSSGVVMLSITVYQICGGSVRRNLQSTESDIKFYGVATAACGNCGTQLGQLTEAALVTIVSDGILSDSIKSNSGGAITLDITIVVQLLPRSRLFPTRLLLLPMGVNLPRIPRIPRPRNLSIASQPNPERTARRRFNGSGNIS